MFNALYTVKLADADPGDLDWCVFCVRVEGPIDLHRSGSVPWCKSPIGKKLFYLSLGDIAMQL